MTFDNQAILISVSGPDRPGITARLTALIADSASAILDMEQVVVQDMLSLSIVLQTAQGAQGNTVLKELLFAAKEMGLDLNFKVLPQGAPVRKSAPYKYILTLIAHEMIPPQVISQVTQRLAENHFNIDKIERLDQEQVRALEMVVSSQAPQETSRLKQELLPISSQYAIDIAIQPDTLFRRVKRLIVFDLDSTLIQAEVIDELARVAGVAEEVRHITQNAMEGHADFRQSLIQRVSLLKGVTLAQMEEVAQNLPLTQGAEQLIRVVKRLGFRTAVISGGFTFFAERIQARLGLDYAHANVLEMENGVLTGRVLEPIIDGEGKAQLLEKIAARDNIMMDQVIAVGDGANDLPMLGRAGMGIAFHAKPMVRQAAQHAINQSHLDAILFLLGINSQAISKL